MNNNMYLFSVHLFILVHMCVWVCVKTHAKHIHAFFLQHSLFIASQCLLHQLTHFVNFSIMYENEEMNGRSFVQPLYIQEIITTRWSSSSSHLLFAVAFCLFVGSRAIWVQVYDTMCGSPLERYLSLLHVYAFSTLTNLKRRFIDYCCDLINFYGVVAVLFSSILCRSVLLALNLYIHIWLKIWCETIHFRKQKNTVIFLSLILPLPCTIFITTDSNTALVYLFGIKSGSFIWRVLCLLLQNCQHIILHTCKLITSANDFA